jgi:hypothetical protein
VKVQPEELSVCLGSYLSGALGDRCAEASGTLAHEGGGSASVRAATRVKPEQAPKVLMGVPSRPDNGEGHRHLPRTTDSGRRTLRGDRRSTHTSTKSQRGRSAPVHAPSGVQRLYWSRPGQKSEEPIVARKPGNAGGAKGLWFGVRLDETDERGSA